MNRAAVISVDEQIDKKNQEIAELESLLREGKNVKAKLEKVQKQRQRLFDTGFVNLSRFDELALARHPRRPYTIDYLMHIAEDYLELHGDKTSGDDRAMFSALVKLRGGVWVSLVGQQKGRTITERKDRNFGCAKPEGYRKALNNMLLAERFSRPIICLIDTPAAECNLAAESHGIGYAIANNMAQMAKLKTPIIAAVIGEGGSGGAIGIGVADRVLMLEHSTYSVIPPEGCANILWKDDKKTPEAAEALQISSSDAFRLGLIEEIIREPQGGAHRDVPEVADRLLEAILRHLEELQKLNIDELLARRQHRFLSIGFYKAE